MAVLHFIPHPAVHLLCVDHPADLIWRAVLDRDDAAMAAIDLREGPHRLLIERAGPSVRVLRLSPAAARFTQRLFDGEPLHVAMEPEAVEEQRAALAEHLSCGRIVEFALDRGTPQ